MIRLSSANTSLPNCIDPNPTIYLPPVEDPKVVRDTIFFERPPGKTHKIKKKHVVLDPFQMLRSVMIPLTEGRALRIMPDGKRPHPQTRLESSRSPSPAQNQEENDPVDNYTLDLITYINQLPPIKGGESPEFKQTKGMFKCFSHFLSNLRKKN
ncbi:hypothetical protein Tco_0298732 [Tanacetum coccineum]